MSSDKILCWKCKKEKTPSKFPLDCHEYCKQCLIDYFQRKIDEECAQLACPRCKTPVEKTVLKAILPEKTYLDYRELKAKSREGQGEAKEKRARKKEEGEEKSETVEKKRKKGEKSEEILEKKQKSEKKRAKKESEEEADSEEKKERKQKKKKEEKSDEEDRVKRKKAKKKAESSEEEEDPVPVKDKGKKHKKDCEAKIEENSLKKAKKSEERPEKTAKTEVKELEVRGKSEEKVREKKISKKPGYIAEQPENIAEICSSCECKLKNAGLKLECGHSQCRYCLLDLIKKQLNKGKLKMKCPHDQKKIPITLAMVTFTEIKEKYVKKFKDLNARFDSDQEESKEEKKSAEAKPVPKVKYSEFCLELSDNPQYMDKLHFSELNDNSSGESFQEKPQSIPFNPYKDEPRSNVKCPKCLKNIDIDPKDGNLIVCDGDSCKRQETKFCLCCKKILFDPSIKTHFPQMKFNLPCVESMAKKTNQNVMVLHYPNQEFANDFRNEKQALENHQKNEEFPKIQVQTESFQNINDPNIFYDKESRFCKKCEKTTPQKGLVIHEKFSLCTVCKVLSCLICGNQIIYMEQHLEDCSVLLKDSEGTNDKDLACPKCSSSQNVGIREGIGQNIYVCGKCEMMFCSVCFKSVDFEGGREEDHFTGKCLMAKKQDKESDYYEYRPSKKKKNQKNKNKKNH